MPDSTASIADFPASDSEPAQHPCRLSRTEQVARLSRATPGLAQRKQAKQLGVSRGRLRHWRQREKSNGAPLQEVAFFESPAGLDLLHRVLVAAHITVTLRGSGGVRQVCEFLELSGLSRHAASSYGCQRDFNARLEELVVEYGRQQRAALGQGMPARQITVGEDETYHPQTCLVGLEPVSGFILLEQYADDRSADTWDGALEEATCGLNVEVIQVVSDQAKGLIRHARNLGAHHSPDLFHVQRDVAKATGLALQRAEKQAEAAVAAASEALAQACREEAGERSKPPRPGRPSNQFERRTKEAELQLLVAQVDLERAKQHREQARGEVRALGNAYHPYLPETGQAQTPGQLQARLETSWANLERIAREASLTERCRRLLDKAKGLTQAMLLTLQFFVTTCQAKVEALNLPPEVEVLMQSHLIPAIYLDRVAGRCAKAEERQRLRQLSRELLRPLCQAGSPLALLGEAERRRLEEVATECADLFQRSSSAVEGRNGQLSLHHHARHRLSDRKLNALTVIHDYLIKRPDGTTAARRFFGREHDDLFQWVLGRIRPPARPAKKRPGPPKPAYLQGVAA
jgi:hypothetical protein